MKTHHLINTVALTFSLLAAGCLKAEKISAVEAQPPGAKESTVGVVNATGPRARQGALGGKMAAALNLTEEQKTQINKALPQWQNSGKGMRNSGASFEDIQNIRKAHMKVRFEIMKPYLTPEQLKIAEEIQQSLDQNKIPKVFVTQRLMRMKQKLGLSDTQLNSLKPILATMEQDKLNAKKNATSFDDFRAANWEIRNKFRQSLASILTEEQLAKIQSFQGQGQGKGGSQGSSQGRGNCL